MFRRIAPIPADADDLFRLHPVQVAGLLERAWDICIGTTYNPSIPFGHPDQRSEIPGLPNTFLQTLRLELQSTQPISTPRGSILKWPHLIYAYMLESTGVFEIFRRVVFELLNGEKLTTISVDAHHWLRTTEELFFRPGSPFFIYSLTSDLRPDSKANRCNAYYRMFGMDLPKLEADGKPYPYYKAEAANRQFVPVFEEFMYEVWKGIINVSNTSGPKDTDNARIATLASDIQNMMLDRRENGNLSREEFWYVSMFAWFHLTLDYNSPIIASLKADASSSGLRLFNLGERVGLRPHPKTEAFFRMAEPISSVLIEIEKGTYSDIANAGDTYFSTPSSPNTFANNLQFVISNWSEATGKNLKSPLTRTN